MGWSTGTFGDTARLRAAELGPMIGIFTERSEGNQEKASERGPFHRPDLAVWAGLKRAIFEVQIWRRMPIFNPEHPGREFDELGIRRIFQQGTNELR